MQLKKRFLKPMSGEGSAGAVNVDDAPGAKQAKHCAKSLLQHVMRQAPKGLTDFALQKQAASGPPLAKKRRNGLLSSWLAQRVRPQAR
jgi:hypothetical protein